jgi:hypothetical protein
VAEAPLSPLLPWPCIGRPNTGKFHDAERSIALQKIVVHGTNQPFRNAVLHSTIRNKQRNLLFFIDNFLSTDPAIRAVLAARSRRLFYMSWRFGRLD